jgi:hypothetical protein
LGNRANCRWGRKFGLFSAVFELMTELKKAAEDADVTMADTKPKVPQMALKMSCTVVVLACVLEARRPHGPRILQHSDLAA